MRSPFDRPECRQVRIITLLADIVDTYDPQGVLQGGSFTRA